MYNLIETCASAKGMIGSGLIYEGGNGNRMKKMKMNLSGSRRNDVDDASSRWKGN